MGVSNVIRFIKGEFSGWGAAERFLFPLALIVPVFISFLINDSKIALVSSVCGMSYTILAGKGKVSCYLIGICGTLCYCIIAYKNGFFGNLALYLLYYLPMQVTGFFRWRKHMKTNQQEIIKTKLSQKERFLYFSISPLMTLLLGWILYKTGGSSPFADAFTVVFSVLGMLLTVKRCYEQWIVWLFVNAVSLYMWIIACLNGANCFATAYMWFVYLILAVYFLIAWKKEINNESV